jgi:hypothetical protein
VLNILKGAKKNNLPLFSANSFAKNCLLLKLPVYFHLRLFQVLHTHSLVNSVDFTELPSVSAVKGLKGQESIARNASPKYKHSNLEFSFHFPLIYTNSQR